MERRDFLKLASLSGLSILSPFSSNAWASGGHPFAPPNDLIVINMIAQGGWDSTSLCDPKGGNYIDGDGNDLGRINQLYTEGEIENAGNIRYAPLDRANLFGNRYNFEYNTNTFFQKYYPNILALNGVDMETTNHRTATDLAWAGRAARFYPALAALHASADSEEKALSYISYGSYDETANLIRPSRIANADRLASLGHINKFSSNDKNILSDENFGRIKNAMLSRLERLRDKTTMPRTRKAISSLHSGYLGTNGLTSLNQYLDSDLESLPNLVQQVKVVSAACAAGICRSANIVRGGFDTHSKHDINQPTRILELLYATDILLEEAQRLGFLDRLVLIVGSDFGRTAYYNQRDNEDTNERGKDHWRYNSLLVMAPDIAGNRVLGTTNARVKAEPFPISLDPNDQTGASAIIGINDFHVSMRKYLGLEDFASAFPLPEANFDLFA